MKIKTNNGIYVQKNDIAYLSISNLNIPASIFMTMFGSEITIIDDSNRYDFVKFSNPEEIEFLSKIDWIIDYNEIKDLSKKQLIEKAKSILEEQRIICKKYNSMSSHDKKLNKELYTKCELLDYEINSLADFLALKEGNSKIELPDGIDYPKDYNRDTKPKSLFKTIFKKKNN